MSNEGSPGIPFCFSKPGFEKQEKTPQAGAALSGFSPAEMNNFSARILSQFAFPDVTDLSSSLYTTLTAEELTTLRAASQPVRDAESQKRAIDTLTTAYERWSEDN